MFDRPQRNNSFRAPEITHRRITATVKWFNPSKGFGFVTPQDGSQDAFVHGTVVQATGHDELPNGTTIVCDLSRSPKGPQVAAIHSVDTTTATPSRGGPGGGPGAGPRMGGGGGGSRGRFDGGDFSSGFGEGEVIEGTVKWFNTAKGFGFVAPNGGGKDVFVHSRALQQSGLDGLADGEQVRVTVRQGTKGPEAARIEVI